LEPALRFQASNINRLASQIFASDNNDTKSAASTTTTAAAGVDDLSFVNPALSVTSDNRSSSVIQESSTSTSSSSMNSSDPSLPLHQLVAWASDSTRLLERRKDVPWVKGTQVLSSTVPLNDNSSFSTRLRSQPLVQSLQERLRDSLGLGLDHLSAIHNLRD